MAAAVSATLQLPIDRAAPAAAAAAPALAAPAVRLPCHVFGMFMAFLDIQIVSSSLNEIQAGLSASADEFLGSDRLPDRRSHRDPALRLPVARAWHPHPVRDLRRGVHARQRHVRDEFLDQQHDRVARAARIHRRRHGADGVCLRLFDFPWSAPEARRAAYRPDRHACADHRTDGRRLFDRRSCRGTGCSSSMSSPASWSRRHRSC